MEKAQAIELLKNAVPAKTMTNEELGFFIEAVSMGISALKQTEWHPLTKEDRPPKGGEYLVEFQGMKVGICQYINGHFRNYGEIFDGMITRWMYLPLSEREEKEMENADGQGQVSG